MLKRSLSAVVAFALVIPLIGILSWAADDNTIGKKVYDSKCAMCHGKEAKADTKAGQMTKTPDLTATPWKHGTSVEEVQAIIRDGAGKMQPFKDKLSSEEIAASAEYIRQLTGVDRE